MEIWILHLYVAIFTSSHGNFSTPAHSEWEWGDLELSLLSAGGISLPDGAEGEQQQARQPRQRHTPPQYTGDLPLSQPHLWFLLRRGVHHNSVSKVWTIWYISLLTFPLDWPLCPCPTVPSDSCVRPQSWRWLSPNWISQIATLTAGKRWRRSGASAVWQSSGEGPFNSP